MNGGRLSELYKIRFAAEALPRKKAIWKVLCQGFFSKFIGPSDTVLDVACGHGEFINHIPAGKKIAVDLNPDARGFLEPGIQFKRCKASEIGKFFRGRADVIFTSNFLEHLPDKRALDGFLTQALLVLRPGGKLMILGPNLHYLPGAYWDFYDHHLGLTHLSLSEALQLHGFHIDHCIGKFLPYSTQGSLPTHPALVWLYLRLPWAWRIFGKQFFILASKP